MQTGVFSLQVSRNTFRGR
uniref:Uncharacterized protein n=1 Tax=Arundo donax TaxID=35708 RepID=A0A0A9AB82_ARUDO